MKPSWDQIMDDYEGSDYLLVADVDCTHAEAKKICQYEGITGYPTIKWGDPTNLVTYKGDRSKDALEQFISERNKKTCGPASLDKCEPHTRKYIQDLMALPLEELAEQVAAKTQEREDVETAYKEEIAKLQEKYTKAQVEKTNGLNKIYKDGLPLMVAVQSFERAAPDQFKALLKRWTDELH